MGKPLTLSIIIPAYNEEDHLPACLDAISRQSVKPYEVLVVDNNSTDKTREIAEKYPFVTLLHERKQGLIPARNKGFGTAKGDVLARIDVDSVLDPHWVERINYIFRDESIDAVAGVGRTLMLPRFKYAHTKFWSIMYLLWVRMIFNVSILWGANMALRRSVWQEIEDELSSDEAWVHEDQDMSVVIAKHHYTTVTDTKLIVNTDSQDKNVWPKYKEYTSRMLRTLRFHQKKGSFEGCRKLYNPLQRTAYVIFIFIPFKTFFLLGMIVSTLTANLKK